MSNGQFQSMKKHVISTPVDSAKKVCLSFHFPPFCSHIEEKNTTDAVIGFSSVPSSGSVAVDSPPSQGPRVRSK